MQQLWTPVGEASSQPGAGRGFIGANHCGMRSGSLVWSLALQEAYGYNIAAEPRSFFADLASAFKGS